MSMDDFEKDLHEAQKETSTCLVRRDRKKAVAYNSSHKYDPSHRSYIDPNISEFAHATWKGVHHVLPKTGKENDAKTRMTVPHLLRGESFVC